MIYEFALEPELVARWHDRKEHLFFDEKFGIRPRRIVSAYPKNWKKLVWAAFRRGLSSDDQNAQMRMTELIQHLWQNCVRRPSTFSETTIWLERAEKEHAERPFRAIVATTNPREQQFVIKADRLIENGHSLWNIPDTPSTPRTAEQIAQALSAGIMLCRHAILVDPYFDPNKLRFRKTLKSILATCEKNVCGLERLAIELHTSIDRFFQGWDQGVSRNPAEEKRVYEKFVTDCKNKLPALMDPGINLKVVIWKQKSNGEKLHNRYLLTNTFGFMFFY